MTENPLGYPYLCYLLFRVDMGESVGVVVDRVKTGVVGDHLHGYKAVGQWDGEEQKVRSRSRILGVGVVVEAGPVALLGTPRANRTLRATLTIWLTPRSFWSG